jgi:hypothetical protein
MIRSKKMRRAAGATPDANGRAVDFDQKSRRKQTRADAKMRRAAEMPLPTMCKPVTGDCPLLFSVRKARWLSSQTRMGTEGITRALHGVDYLRFQSSTYESVGHSDQPPNAIAAVVRGRSRLATAHSMPRTKGFACWSYGPKLSNPLTSPLWRLIPVDQQTHAQTSRSQDLAGIDWD